MSMSMSHHNAHSHLRAAKNFLPRVTLDEILGAVKWKNRRRASPSAKAAVALVAVGLLAGAAIALLLAPASGAELRREAIRRLGLGLEQTGDHTDGEALDELSP